MKKLEYEWHKTNLPFWFTDYHKSGRITQLKQRKSVKKVWNIVTHILKLLDTGLKLKSVFSQHAFLGRNRIVVLLKCMKTIWTRVGRPIPIVIVHFISCTEYNRIYTYLWTNRIKVSKNEPTILLKSHSWNKQ